MKHYVDKGRRDKEFNIGDLVLVKLQPYRQHSLQLRRNNKLSLRDFGPFPITQQIGKVAYRLQLPDSAWIHPVLDISMLTEFKRIPKDQYIPLPLTITERGPSLHQQLFCSTEQF